MDLKTINFEVIPADVKIPEETKYAYDLRNGIVCYSPTLDLKCYYNYIQFLNLCRNDWTSNGYLDMGMVPLVMLPSFFPEQVRELISNVIQAQGINVYAMPPVSNLKGTYRGVTSDVGVFRKDLAKVLNVREKDATLSNWLRTVMRYS